MGIWNLIFQLVQQQDKTGIEGTQLHFYPLQQHVQPGTVVHSDEWAAYSQISSAGYTHSTVNHSLHFVDPITGTHTQHIESYWSRAKSKIKKMHGTTDNLPEYLDEYMNGRTGKEAYESMINHIKEQYPFP